MTPDEILGELGNPDEGDFVTGRLEPCAGYTTDGTGSPVCAACGWLDREHTNDADVTWLPGPVVAKRRAARLAS